MENIVHSPASSLPDIAASPSAFLELAQACSSCTTETEFGEIVRKMVRPLLPHGLLAAVIGRIDFDQLEILSFVGVDYPEKALAQLSMQINLRERPVVKHWLTFRQPLLLDLKDHASMLSERERFEIETFSLGRLAIHGVLDLSAKTGSYFSFGKVTSDFSSSSITKSLRILVPHLHQALMTIYERQPTKSYISLLSPTEQELLQWVAAGRSNAEIATLRKRSIATIRNQLHSAYAKLGVSSRSEAIRITLTNK